MPTIATLTMNPALDITTTTPELRPTDKLRCSEPSHNLGGGGINVARAIHVLGGDALALFPAGGQGGAILEELLDEQGVPHQAIPIAGRTRESLTVNEAQSGLQYRFIMPGPTLSHAELNAVFDALRHLPGPPDILVVSGSLPPGTPHDFLARVAALARTMGARLVLDSSAISLRQARKLDAWLIKPNLQELEELAGRKLPDEVEAAKAAHALIDQRIADHVVVSLGEDGALLVSKGGEEHFAAIAVAPVSAVGAGDTMLGAIVLAVSQGKPLREAVRYGVAAGAAALLSPETGLSDAADVARLYAEIERRDGSAA